MEGNSIYVNDVHMQFADCFDEPVLRPYAYWLSKKMAEGHICIDVLDLKSEQEKLPFDKLSDLHELAEMKDWIAIDQFTVRPFVLYKNRFYLHRYFKYETRILNTLKKSIEYESALFEKRVAELESIAPLVRSMASGFQSSPEVTIQPNTDWQLVAAITAYCNNFTIITGGPGTGKTTTVAKVLSLLYAAQPDLKVALAAPTGKAAMRMGESLKASMLNLSDETRSRFNKLIPSTIHRLLGYRFDSVYFKHDALNPLPHDVLIVDEASMIDVALFAKLLSAIGPQTRLILLGDRNQLASVEAGSLFGDLCRIQNASNVFSPQRAMVINTFIENADAQISPLDIVGTNNPMQHHVIELRTSHRFNIHSGIGKLSKAIINNDVPALNEFISDDNYTDVKIDTGVSEKVFEEEIAAYETYIQEPDIKKALAAINNFRVLCAVREGPRGLYDVNAKIEKILKKRKIKNADGTSFNPEGEFYENRPIIVTQNSKELDIFNGDVGIIRKDTQGNYKACFEDGNKEIRQLPPAYLGRFETVFAMTIHKSQGSEYDKILVLLPSGKDNHLLTRELLYTAVTRARKSVLIQAEKDIILKTSSASVSRVSGITGRTDEIG
jgi:exodeoxyribonuclease V alpha subunit